MRDTGDIEAQGLKARVLVARQDRDRKLAAVDAVFLPRLKALHDEWRSECDAVWTEYDARIEQLKAAA